MNPYFIMVVMYLSLAALTAAYNALASLQIIPLIPGLGWLRVHFITLGAITQAIFGLLPSIMAARAKAPRPQVHWDRWVGLNIGLVLLLIGIPLVNAVLIISGGTFVFYAVIRLILHVMELKQASVPNSSSERAGKKFYLAGLGFFLIGIIIGSGLWFGWAGALQIKIPLETHIHANIWGFIALTFAGLLVDQYPTFSGRSFAWPKSIGAIFWMLVVGATGLIAGPWLNARWLMVPGMLLQLAATGLLLANMIRPLLGDRSAWTPGLLHLLASYAWILGPVIATPLVLLNATDVPTAAIESKAPTTLVYGWMLQFGYAFLPYFFRRIFQAGDKPRLGGNWFSLVTIQMGTALIWASAFSRSQANLLYGIAFGVLALSMIPILIELGRILEPSKAPVENFEVNARP